MVYGKSFTTTLINEITIQPEKGKYVWELYSYRLYYVQNKQLIFYFFMNNDEKDMVAIISSYIDSDTDSERGDTS